ncbi:MAG: HNH endonuclease [Planctomycetes bacterium]|nr:HNH endonuclease [Planctomycetota bacterium]
MATGQERRQHLFKAYAAQLTAIGHAYADFPKIEDTFLCPFCCQTFGQDALDAPPRLTVEHCIPESLGGTTGTSTLICAGCNNRMGASVDAHLSRKYEADAFLTGTSAKTKRVTVEMGRGRARADMKVTAGERTHVTVTFDRDHSQPQEFDEAMRALEEGMKKPEGFKWKFDVNMGYKPKQTRVALLRIGFLMMFRQFGYPYVLDSNLAQVREQLLNPESDVITGPVEISLPSVPPRVNVVGIVQQPVELQSFVVVVRLKSGSRALHKAIFMPGLDGCPDVYAALQAAQQTSKSLNTTLTTFTHDPKYISDPKYITLPDQLWRGFNTNASGDKQSHAQE